MGENSDRHVSMYTSGKWGIPIPPAREYPRTTKEAIKDCVFSIVKTLNNGKSNRMPGEILLVTDQNEDFYWVWASKQVTGIAKAACEILETGLSIQEAIETRQQKYARKQAKMRR